MAEKKNGAASPDEDIITLEYDDGTVEECTIEGVFDANDKEYIALVPDNDSGDVYIYGYEEIGDDEFDLTELKDDDEFDAAVREYEKIKGVSAEKE